MNAQAASTVSEDDYDMVQHPDMRSAPDDISLYNSTDGSEAIAHGPHPPSAADEMATQSLDSDVRSVSSEALANLALGSPTWRVYHNTLSSIQEDDMQAVAQPAPRMPGRMRDIYMKILLLGESGLGKTTLTRQLLRSYANEGIDNVLAHDGSSSSMEQFKTKPDSLCTKLEPVVIPDKDLKLHVKIQDVPGWGDEINIYKYLHAVMTHIMEQRVADYNEFHGHAAFDKQYVSGSLKHSVTACLYFLPPHRTKPIDLILMSALSKVVTLIPVIAKADAMNQTETERYRQEVLARLNNPNEYVERSEHSGLPELKIDYFRFSSNDLRALGVETPVPPFTIITSEQFDEFGRPLRQYLWGTCDATNRSHSDFILLKRLLMGDKVDSLWCMLDDSYDRYVLFADAYKDSSLERLVAAACEACGPHLEYVDDVDTQTQVTQLEADKQQLLADLAAAKMELEDKKRRVLGLGLVTVLMALGVLLLLLTWLSGVPGMSRTGQPSSVGVAGQGQFAANNSTSSMPLGANTTAEPSMDSSSTEDVSLGTETFKLLLQLLTVVVLAGKSAVGAISAMYGYIAPGLTTAFLAVIEQIVAWVGPIHALPALVFLVAVPLLAWMLATV